MLLQWTYIYQVLANPEKSMENTNSNYFTKVLIVSVTIYTLIMVVDFFVIACADPGHYGLEPLYWLETLLGAVNGIVIMAYLTNYLLFI